jgi:hypothetical protein
MTEEQKERIVEMARIAESELCWASNFDPADPIRFTARYAARWASAEAFRLAKAQP